MWVLHSIDMPSELTITRVDLKECDFFLQNWYLLSPYHRVSKPVKLDIIDNPLDNTLQQIKVPVCLFTNRPAKTIQREADSKKSTHWEIVTINLLEEFPVDTSFFVKKPHFAWGMLLNQNCCEIVVCNFFPKQTSCI